MNDYEGRLKKQSLRYRLGLLTIVKVLTSIDKCPTCLSNDICDRHEDQLNDALDLANKLLDEPYVAAN